MSTWDDVAKAIEAGSTARTVAAVLTLGDAERREAGRELPGRLKSMIAGSAHGFLFPRYQEPLLLAGAATIGGAAAAAAWLCRRDLRIRFSRDGYAGFCRELDRVTAFRPAAWRAEVAHRVAARVRATDGDWFPWHVAATLSRSAGGPAPESDGFVIGWVTLTRPEDADAYPFLETLVPRLFEVDGAGTALSSDPSEEPMIGRRGGSWALSIAELARAGRLDRTALLDGCVGRFLRGGTARELRWFIRLHAALDPTDEEAADRVRDYVRLLPAAPANVADLALRHVPRADGLGRLDPALFEEAAGAVLFRPERKLAGAALTWLDRTARERDRVEATLRAVTAVFGSDDLDLRERAVTIAAKHLAEAGGPVRAEVREAAAALPPSLLAAHSAAFGGVAAASAAPESPAGPPPFVPRPSPTPIGSLAELVEELTVLLLAIDKDWRAAERCLAALVAFAHRDADATRAALRGPVSDIALWITEPDSPYADGMWLDYAVRRLFFPHPREWPPCTIGPFFGEPDRTRPVILSAQMERFVSWRLHEIGYELGRVPVLLATPTEGSGHVDPDALVERLERLERAGAEPGLADLTQALLRLPRRIDPSTTARARSLTSPAGRSAASWLASGGLEDPAVACAVLDEPKEAVRGRRPPLATGVLATVAAPGRSVLDAGAAGRAIARLCAFPEEGRDGSGTEHYHALSEFWPSVLPSHREITAAQLVPCLAETVDHALSQGAIMRDLAEADGPTGAATGTLLALALSNKHPRERADAAEAFLALAARDALPAAETGEALGRIASRGRVPPGRAVKALTAACDAGAGAAVWETLTAALPHLLPGPGEPAPNGTPAVLELATRTAESLGAKGPIPAVADVASRGGSSRVVTAAARLHRTLAT